MIDCHVHFWNYNPVEFPWIFGALQPIARDMLPMQLKESVGHNINGIIAVQARPTLDENVFLANIAAKNTIIKGIIGWFDFEKTASPQLEEAKTNPLFKGFRHLIQDEHNPSDYLLNHNGLNQSLKAIQKADFVYEVLIKQPELPAALKFCARHDENILVIDHLAKPIMSDTGEFTKWHNHMRNLSHMDHVMIKISGLVSEAKAQVDGMFFQKFIDTVFQYFGPERLLWGSDWPVSFASHSYKTLLNYWSLWTKNWTVEERKVVENSTPLKIYKLQPTT